MNDHLSEPHKEVILSEIKRQQEETRECTKARLQAEIERMVSGEPFDTRDFLRRNGWLDDDKHMADVPEGKNVSNIIETLEHLRAAGRIRKWEIKCTDIPGGETITIYLQGLGIYFMESLHDEAVKAEVYAARVTGSVPYEVASRPRTVITVLGEMAEDIETHFTIKSKEKPMCDRDKTTEESAKAVEELVGKEPTEGSCKNQDLPERFLRFEELIESAWGLIANAYGGNWDSASEASGWKAAAERWRGVYHKTLPYSSSKTEVPVDAAEAAPPTPEQHPAMTKYKMLEGRAAAREKRKPEPPATVPEQRPTVMAPERKPTVQIAIVRLACQLDRLEQLTAQFNATFASVLMASTEVDPALPLSLPNSCEMGQTLIAMADRLDVSCLVIQTTIDAADL